MVLDGNPRFFRITKRLHNFLHGSPGDGGSLGDAERAEYESVLAGNLYADEVTGARWGHRAAARPAGSRDGAGATCSRRACRVALSHRPEQTPTELTDVGWDFLKPYVSQADGTTLPRSLRSPMA